MSETEATTSPERRQVVRTTVFRLSNPALHEECLRQRRAIPFGAEPVFAAKSFPVDTTSDGLAKLAQELFELLPEEVQTQFDPGRMSVVEENPLETLTEKMTDGELRYVPLEEYPKAYIVAHPHTEILIFG